MKTVLLDVNVLIALLWPAHEHHDAAHNWFKPRGKARWASCPLTQLAFVRIVSNPAFSRDAPPPLRALELLQRNLKHPGHVFWPDDLEGVEALAPHGRHLQGHRQLMDVYLLELARLHRGRLATFDAGIEQFAPEGRTGVLEVVATG